MIFFYSWQSDAPRNINHDFIAKAINDTLSVLKDDSDLTDAIRESGEPMLDHDTQGLMGAVPIAQAIFEKIANADVFIADVSLVAISEKSKKHINSNVAIELGFAFSKCSYEKVVNVMNTYYGEATELPFDLRDKRHPVKYNLSEGASKAEIAAEGARLSRELLPFLKTCLFATTTPSRVQQENHVPATSTYISSTYWMENELLCAGVAGKVGYSCSSSHLISVRIIPSFKQPELSRAEAKEIMKGKRPLVVVNGYRSEQNKWGAISFDNSRNDYEVISGMQLMLTPEIWGFTEGIIWRRSNGETDETDYESRWTISNQEIMEYLPDGIKAALALGKEAITGPSTLEVCASDLRDVWVRHGGGIWPEQIRCHDESVRIEVSVDDDIDPTKVARDFAIKLYGSVGLTLSTVA